MKNFSLSLHPILRALRACFALFVATLAPSLHSQSPDDLNEGSRLIPDTTPGYFSFSWWGRDGMTYFVQNSDDLRTWSYLPIIEQGGDAPISYGFAADASIPFFLRLRITDQPEDEINALWEQVPDEWKLALVNDPNKSIYDPDNLIDDVSKVLPHDDYNGNGWSNLEEWLAGTDPTDFFNGDAPQVYIISGNYQRAMPEETCRHPLVVLVLDSGGNKLKNAPVVFTVDSGGGTLSPITPGAATETGVVLRTHSSSRSPRLYYRQPSAAGVAGTVTANAGGTTATFDLVSLTQPSTAIPDSPENLTTTYNSDGSRTLSWTNVSSHHHYHTIYVRDSKARRWVAGVAPPEAESYTVPAAVINNLP